METTRITIVLELDQSTDRPYGCARLADGTSQAFHGWIGLTEAIDALTQTPSSVTPSDTTQGKETR